MSALGEKGEGANVSEGAESEGSVGEGEDEDEVEVEGEEVRRPVKVSQIDIVTRVFGYG